MPCKWRKELRGRPRLVCSCLVLLVILRCQAIYVPSRNNTSKPAYCTVYNHLVKSGGTSIKEQLIEGSRVEGSQPPGLCISDGSSSTSAEACYSALRNSTVIMGYGELLRNPLRDEGRDCQWFMMMRHPIHQLISAFYYCPEHDVQRRPIEMCGNFGESHEPLRERLVKFAKARWTNMTYRQMLHSIFCQPWFEFCSREIARYWHQRPFSLDTDEGRETLLKIQGIMRSYTAIGIVEHWKLSMELFDAVIVSPVREWNQLVAYNQGPQSLERQSLLKWALLDPEIHSVLSADLLLYNYGVFVFKHQTSQALGTTWRDDSAQELSALTM
ncbi:unnamed protein product [Ascophyllum nodosum]